MVTSKAAHASLDAFCQINGNRHPGIAIGAELLTYLAQMAIKVANKKSNVAYQASEFASLPIKYQVVVNSTEPVVTIVTPSTAPGASAPPRVLIGNVKCTISIQLGSTMMSVHTLAYAEIRATVITSAKGLQLACESAQGQWGAAQEHWHDLEKLSDGRDFTLALRDEWRVTEKAALMVAKDLFGPTFCSSIEIPDFIRMISAFQFVGPPRVGVSNGLIMLSGPGDWVEACPRRGASPAIGVTDENKANDAIDFETDFEKDRESQPVPVGRMERAASSDFFVHLPQTFISKRFDGTVKPGVGFTDNGYAGPIYWHYETAILVEAIEVSLDSIWPLEMTVSVPSVALGSAGAGVKVGCVYWEATGAAFQGRIDPLKFRFVLGFDPRAFELYFEANTKDVKAHDFNFHHWPDVLKFPMDEVADFILGRVAETTINQQAGSLLARARFTLGDFRLFKRFGDLANALSAESTGNESLTIGLVMNKKI